MGQVRFRAVENRHAILPRGNKARAQEIRFGNHRGYKANRQEHGHGNGGVCETEKEMIYFILGFMSGVMAVGFLFVVLVLLKRPTEKLILSLEKKLSPAIDGEPVILEPTPSDVEAMEAVIAENESKGRDTNISEEL